MKTRPVDVLEGNARMVVTKGKLGIIGAGVMGRALIQGMISRGVLPADKIWAATRSESSRRQVEQESGVHSVVQYEQELQQSDIVILCVKPSGISKVLDTLKQSGLSKDTLVISVAAGTTIQFMENRLGTENPVIRAMPNTPCVVGQGMTVICPGSYATDGHLQQAQAIFESVGQCIELEEIHFNAVTALGGSGPAYFFLIMEALADGGVRVGLPRDVALKIVSQTALGAATMVQKMGRHPASLRDDVTTPAGCTIGALLTMEDGKIRSVLARAVEEATTIAAQLGEK